MTGSTVRRLCTFRRIEVEVHRALIVRIMRILRDGSGVESGRVDLKHGRRFATGARVELRLCLWADEVMPFEQFESRLQLVHCLESSAAAIERVSLAELDEWIRAIAHPFQDRSRADDSLGGPHTIERGQSVRHRVITA